MSIAVKFATPGATFSSSITSPAAERAQRRNAGIAASKASPGSCVGGASAGRGAGTGWPLAFTDDTGPDDARLDDAGLDAAGPDAAGLDDAGAGAGTRAASCTATST